MDILPQMLSHHYSLGFRHFYLMDNDSVDGTLEYIKDFAPKGAKVTVLVDKGLAYEQSARTNKMARMAYEDGLSWIFPLDADEFIKDIKDIEEYVAQLPHKNGIIKINWFDYPFLKKHFENKESDSPFYKTLTERLEKPNLDGNGKRAVFYNPDMKFNTGNHLVKGAKKKWELLVLDDSLNLAHYRFRSAKQFKLKIKTHMKSVSLVGKGGYDQLQVEYEKALREDKESDFWLEIIERHLTQFKSLNLVEDPLPYRGEA